MSVNDGLESEVGEVSQDEWFWQLKGKVEALHIQLGCYLTEEESLLFKLSKSATRKETRAARLKDLRTRLIPRQREKIQRNQISLW